MPPHFIDGQPHTHPDRPKRVRTAGEPLRIGIGDLLDFLISAGDNDDAVGDNTGSFVVRMLVTRGR